MHYFSTSRSSRSVTFREAVLNGQPEDRGLYFPSEIPLLSEELLSSLSSMDNGEIAFEVIKPYVNHEITDDVLRGICNETVNFDFPLVEISPGISTLELFHGPTLAFKDVGARFMSRCLRYFSSEKRKTVVIVATSGDTGGAVANGFYGVDGVEVIILYPSGKVSRVQELQLTTLSGNVTTLELHGNFDDCQAIAKQALADTDISEKGDLTSANSINVARWLPQQFYYFFALKQWKGEAPIISVPSGNFGNLASGMLANVSGLPVKKFIAACNANDVVPRFLTSESYEPRRSIATLSNAMDVGSPSNFVRIQELFANDLHSLRNILEAVSISDEATAATMKEVKRRYDYTLDPHGAVGYRALADRIEKETETSGFFLETAHPVKFDSVTEIIGETDEVPEAVSELFSKEKYSIKVENDYAAVKEIILSKI